MSFGAGRLDQNNACSSGLKEGRVMAAIGSGTYGSGLVAP